LPARSYDDARAICATSGGIWCAHVEAIRHHRASGPTMAVTALGTLVCFVVLLRRALRRRRSASLATASL